MRRSMALGFGVALALVGACGEGTEEAGGFVSRGQAAAASGTEWAGGSSAPLTDRGLAGDRPVAGQGLERSAGELGLPEPTAPRRELADAQQPQAQASVALDRSAVAPIEPELEPQEPVSVQPAAAPAPGSFAYREALAFDLIQAGQFKEAAIGFSDLIQDALIAEGGGEDTSAIQRWVAGLERAQARHRWRALGDWPAVEVAVEPGEGLIVLRKRVLDQHPGLLICTGLIARANQLPNPDVLQPGDTLRIPVDQANILVDLSARWAFYRFGDEIAAAWPVGVGKEGKETPPGRYTVGVKQQNPPWHRRGQPMVPFGDPENPLGTHWVGWIDENGRTTDVGFHGTSDEGGVGGAVSRGCLRMRNADVRVLHDTLPQGARITVQG